MNTYFPFIKKNDKTRKRNFNQNCKSVEMIKKLVFYSIVFTFKKNQSNEERKILYNFLRHLLSKVKINSNLILEI